VFYCWQVCLIGKRFLRTKRYQFFVNEADSLVVIMLDEDSAVDGDLESLNTGTCCYFISPDWISGFATQNATNFLQQSYFTCGDHA